MPETVGLSFSSSGIAGRIDQQIILRSRWPWLVSLCFSLLETVLISRKLDCYQFDALRSECQDGQERGPSSFVCGLIPLYSYTHYEVVRRTGVHTVADVFCVGCTARLGWYYYKASDQSQKYKEGKQTRDIGVLRLML